MIQRRRRPFPSLAMAVMAFLFQCFLGYNYQVEAWSNPNCHQRHQPLQQPETSDAVSTHSGRRQFLWKTMAAAIGPILTTSTVSQAACLPGDLSKECIGVYKVPIDDRILPYVSTPEALKRFAPDLNYVPPMAVPSSVAMAWEILETQRLAVNDIQQVVQKGKLEEAGIKVLNLVPKVTQSGKVILDDCFQHIVKSLSTTSVVKEMTMNRLESQWEMVLGLWGETDVMIGQALKGEMGVSAVAQIYLLNQIKDATAAMDDFMTLAALTSEKSLSSIAK